MNAAKPMDVPTGKSQRREWRRFLITILIVILPTALAVLGLEAVAWQIGETMPMRVVAKWQSEAPDRMWRGGDGRSFLTYKVARVRELRPEVIALGASRANSFRADAFAPYSFYNAGLTSWTFRHYSRFIELVARDGYVPKVLIFNFDYWMFHPDFDRHWVERFYEEPTTHLADLKIVLDQIGKDPKALWQRLSETDRLRGLSAVLSAQGFRPDGSLFGAPATPNPARLLNDGTGAGVPPVEFADTLSPVQRRRFEQFTALAKSKGIALIGIQVPYYEKILNGLNDEPRAGIWREFRSPESRRYFEEQGVIYFDFADMPEYRSKPEHFIDSIHPDARVIRHVMRLVFADPRVQRLLPKAEAIHWAAN